MLVLYTTLTARALRDLSVEYLLIFRVVIWLCWLSFLDHLDSNQDSPDDDRD